MSSSCRAPVELLSILCRTTAELLSMECPCPAHTPPPRVGATHEMKGVSPLRGCSLERPTGTPPPGLLEANPEGARREPCGTPESGPLKLGPPLQGLESAHTRSENGGRRNNTADLSEGRASRVCRHTRPKSYLTRERVDN